KAAAEDFDLVRMDMQMPELDGYGATAELRRRGFSRPVIALTAHAMAEEKPRCLAAGCTDYLAKPITRQSLLETVSRYVKSSRKVRAARISSPTPMPTQTGGKLLRSDFAADPKMEALLSRFIQRLPQRVEPIRRLL